MRRTHVRDVARLHAALLNGLLAGLGERTIRAVYRAYLSSPRCIAFVDEEGSRLRGFVLGSDEPAALRASLFGLPLILRTALAAARRPKVWSWLLNASAAFDTHEAELTYIVSTKNGVGTELLHAFDAALRARGRGHYALSVESTNTRAIHFYEAKGLQRASRYAQFGVSHFRYRRAL
jgi:ribosomal protein S18 acetylase RimI-like enzyme